MSLRFHSGEDRLTTTAFLSPAALTREGHFSSKPSTCFFRRRRISRRADEDPFHRARMPCASDEVDGECPRKVRCSSDADPAMSLLPIATGQHRQQSDHRVRILEVPHLRTDLEPVATDRAVTATTMVGIDAGRPTVSRDVWLLARMYRAALAGRLQYVLHRVSGHAVVWKRSLSDLPLCDGDIVCESCAQVLWCRAHDPWSPVTRRRGAVPDDHWGGISEDAARHGQLLFEALDRVLGLTGRLPSGTSSAEVRRSACELIEANSTAERHARFRRLVNTIHVLQQGRAAQADDASSAVIEQLLAALRDDVAPILLKRGQN